eukprot:6208671-Pleurochrysis_carterae.AAC.1
MHRRTSAAKRAPEYTYLFRYFQTSKTQIHTETRINACTPGQDNNHGPELARRRTHRKCSSLGRCVCASEHAEHVHRGALPRACDRANAKSSKHVH